MNLRTLSAFILMISIPTSSLAQFGTLEEVIEAGVYGTEPEYVAEVMAELVQKLKSFVPKDLSNNPKKKLFCFQAMLEVMSASLDQAMLAAERATTELMSAKKAAHEVSRTSDWFKAVDAAFQASPFKDYAMSFIDPNLNADCWYAAWQAARKVLEEERKAQKAAGKAQTNWIPHSKVPAIAFQGAQWGALNWLLQHFEAIISKTYDKIAQSYYVADNPFETRKSSIALYEKHFKSLSERALVFLVPIRIYLLPKHLELKEAEYYPGLMPHQPTPEEMAQATLMWGLVFPDLCSMY